MTEVRVVRGDITTTHVDVISSVNEFVGQDAGLEQVVFVCFDQEHFDLYIAAGCSL